MAMTINTDGDRGAKKAVDAELNLVPFIDLLVCCICFLLITAVWTKVAQLRAEQGSSTGETTKPKLQPPSSRITVLAISDGVRYQHLVEALETARSRSIPRVRVSDASLRL